MIKTISIKNVRGIDNKSLNVDLSPNKPSILIAPNGFGKSSIARAFDSMNRDRIKLDEEDFHLNLASNTPEVKLEWRNESTIETLTANENQNEISSCFDYFVISSNIRAKGIGRTFGGRTQVSASIVADPIILYDTVPTRTASPYSFANAKVQCSWLSKAVINLSLYLGKDLFCSKIVAQDIILLLKKTSQTRQIEGIANFRTRVESAFTPLNKAQILSHIETNELAALSSISHIATLARFFRNFEDVEEQYKDSHSFVCAIQLSEMFRSNPDALEQYCERRAYEFDKSRLIDLFDSFNSSWQTFTPKETNGSLVIEFPKLHHISNGQRDSLNFIASLEKAKRKLKKTNSILIIDEVFDYMDEANIVSAQYYITKLIDEYALASKHIYPIILTHLSAELFSGFVFSNKKTPQVRYLNETTCLVSEQFKKLLRERGEKTSILKQPIENKLLHFNTAGISLRSEFRQAGLKETWGESGVFRSYTSAEMTKYLDESQSSPFDPAAVCCELRVKIEELAFGKIESPDSRAKFIDVCISGTNEKLEYCESIGIEIPEHFYLLGLIYNEALHWKDNDGFERKIISRLKNLTIRRMIKMIFQQGYHI